MFNKTTVKNSDDPEFDIEHLAVAYIDRDDGETTFGFMDQDNITFICSDEKHAEFILRFRAKIQIPDNQ